MKPNNIFLVRHGQSIGNHDKSMYSHTPDYALTLTELGIEQADQAGWELSQEIKSSNVKFYVSPFWRTRQTYKGIRKYFPDVQCSAYEDPRLREQEWGHLRNETIDYEKITEDRDQYGHFYYRFPDGESCADVYDRVSDMIGTIHRDFEKPTFPKNVVIVTHGMTMRLFIMRWFHHTVEEFESWANPHNCEIWKMTLNQNTGKYNLEDSIRKHKLLHKWQFKW